MHGSNDSYSCLLFPTYARVLCHDLCPLNAAPEHVGRVALLALLLRLRTGIHFHVRKHRIVMLQNRRLTEMPANLFRNVTTHICYTL